MTIIPQPISYQVHKVSHSEQKMQQKLEINLTEQQLLYANLIHEAFDSVFDLLWLVEATKVHFGEQFAYETPKDFLTSAIRRYPTWFHGDL